MTAVRNSHVVGSFWEDLELLLRTIDELRNSLHQERQRFVPPILTPAERAKHLNERSLRLKERPGDDSKRAHSPDQLVQQRPVRVDDQREGLGVAQVHDRIALDIADVLKLRIGQVDESINPRTQFRHQSVIGASPSSVGSTPSGEPAASGDELRAHTPGASNPTGGF